MDAVVAGSNPASPTSPGSSSKVEREKEVFQTCKFFALIEKHKKNCYYFF